MIAILDNEDDDERGLPTKHRQQHTALGHLRAVLGLTEDQTDAMVETFPALAELHPEKLDLPAKLVRVHAQRYANPTPLFITDVQT